MSAALVWLWPCNNWLIFAARKYKNYRGSLRYFIELSYQGTAYHGWQNQPNAVSVQEKLEQALSLILRRTTEVVGAGRTDAGVHARQIFAHFDFFEPIDLKELQYKLNSILPKDIAVRNIFEVQAQSHARFDAVSRSYEYHIVQQKDPFSIHRAFYLKLKPDVEKMNLGAKILLEYTNFKCFSRSRTDVKTYNCRIIRAEWIQEADKLIFYITADRFLRNMVRAVVGTLLDIGLGKLEVEAMHEIIKSENRGEAGASVPAHGLYLTGVEYPLSIRK